MFYKDKIRQSYFTLTTLFKAADLIRYNRRKVNFIRRG